MEFEELVAGQHQLGHEHHDALERGHVDPDRFRTLHAAPPHAGYRLGDLRTRRSEVRARSEVPERPRLGGLETSTAWNCKPSRCASSWAISSSSSPRRFRGECASISVRISLIAIDGGENQR